MGTPSDHGPSKELKNRATPIKEGIAVRNAGIVLLNDYISILFKRLNLIFFLYLYSSLVSMLFIIYYLLLTRGSGLWI